MVHIYLGQARDAGKLKFKLVLQARGAGVIVVGACLGTLQTSAFLRTLVVKHSTMDGGHKHFDDSSHLCVFGSKWCLYQTG